jgi:cysteine synthase A
MLTGNVSQSVGQTPLIHLKSISALTGCEIYGKAEFLNPGGSVKDRAALGIIEAAEKSGQLQPGMTIFEGTAGNTGIGIATIAAQKKYSCVIVMPDNQAVEKFQTLEALGAKVIKVAPVPFANPNHFYHTAKKLAEDTAHSFWANQFENTANSDQHYRTTGSEIWDQTQGRLDYFVAATGTGGTISGVSRYLKEKNANIKIVLADPMGSGMHSYFQTQEIKSSGSSVTEGIGIMRLTANFKLAKIDDSVQVEDQKMINMMYHLAKNEGLLVGTSAALNVYAAYLIGLRHKGEAKTIVTVLCDSALRYQSRVFNPDWLAKNNLNPLPIT